MSKVFPTFPTKNIPMRKWRIIKFTIWRIARNCKIWLLFCSSSFPTFSEKWTISKVHGKSFSNVAMILKRFWNLSPPRSFIKCRSHTSYHFWHSCKYCNSNNCVGWNWGQHHHEQDKLFTYLIHADLLINRHP